MNSLRVDLQRAVLETTWGSISIEAGPCGVVACRLPFARAQSVPLRVIRVRLPRGASPVLRRAVAFARTLVAGRAPEADRLWNPWLFAGATVFRRAIWNALSRIPRGRTATYSELARMAGYPRAARAAGTACGANPVPLFVPCHRAVAAGGGLGGFSAGLAWKNRLLSAEWELP